MKDKIPQLRPIFVLLAFLSLVDCANILSIFPIPSKSHDILGFVLSKHLANIGHNVTFISPFSHKKDMGNFHLIQIEKMEEFKDKILKHAQGKISYTDLFSRMLEFGDISKLFFEDEDVQQLINSDSKFDVMINFMGFDGSLSLAHRFDLPVILFAPLGGLPPHNRIVANPAPPSYIPTIATPFKEDMTFLQRVANTLVPPVFFGILEKLFEHLSTEYVEKYLPGCPPIRDIIEERVDLVLVNSHISTESPRPYVPNMIQIGGFHLHKPDPLSEDLKKVLDDAKEGFVYFSFGTNVRVKNLPPNVLDIFKKTLGKLPFKIIMKYDDDTLPNKPDNFYVRKWFPQPSVLAHPNIKLFISHGGYGGTTESLYYGVPLVCIPFFGDQAKNCADAEYNGYSVTVDIETMDEKTFSNALEKVLYDETFKQAIKFKSELYRDQPMNPMDKAVYWIEHVIKHKGAKHLKVKGTQLPWYQYYLIDVFLFIGLVITLVLSFVYHSCRFMFTLMYRRLFQRKNKMKTN